MTKEKALQFKEAIDAKLKAESVPVGNHLKAKQALEPCVMGNILIKAYDILYIAN